MKLFAYGAPRPRVRSLAIAGALAACLTSATAAPALANGSTYDISRFAGTGVAGPPVAGPATSSRLNSPDGIAVDSAGNVYIADSSNREIEKVTPAGQISVIAGNGNSGPAANGPATSSDLNEPEGVAVDSSGDVYIADYGDCEVDEVTPAGQLTVIAGTGVCGAPTAGTATSSRLGEVWAVAVDSSDNVYISDGYNERIEKVTPGGQLSFYAGDGQSGEPTPGAALSSRLEYPMQLAFDSSGNLYIADYDASEIEKVTPQGTLSIVAGTQAFTTPTPGPATGSALDCPFGIAVDAAGDLFIADTYNYDEEEVDTSGNLSVIAGNNSVGTPTYGGAATSSHLDYPYATAVAADGTVYIADSSNNTIDKLTPPAPSNSTAPAVTGGTNVGDTLTATGGDWVGDSGKLDYAWEDCDSSGANCTPISGATSSSYTLVASDAGHTVRVVVTASNAGGSTTAQSQPTSLVLATPSPSPTLTPTPLSTPIAHQPKPVERVVSIEGPASAQQLLVGGEKARVFCNQACTLHVTLEVYYRALTRGSAHEEVLHAGAASMQPWTRVVVGQATVKLTHAGYETVVVRIAAAHRATVKDAGSILLGVYTHNARKLVAKRWLQIKVSNTHAG